MKVPTKAELRHRGVAARNSQVGAILMSWDFLVAVPLAAGTALLPAYSKTVTASAQTVLLAFGAVSGTLAALTLTGTGMLLNAMTPAYRAVLRRLPHGERGSLDPFLVVVRLAALSAVVAFGAALAWPLVRDHRWYAFVVFGVAAAVTFWSLLGFVQVVGSQLPMHLRNSGDVERLADAAKKRTDRTAS